MTHLEARRTFVSLMGKAREGKLTAADRKRLTEARQLLRRARRPAMNARRSAPQTRTHYIVRAANGAVWSGAGWTARKSAARRYASEQEAREVGKWAGGEVIRIDPVRRAKLASIKVGDFVWVNRSRLGRMEAAGLPSYVFSHRGLVMARAGERVQLRFAGVPIDAPNRLWFDLEVLDKQNAPRRRAPAPRRVAIRKRRSSVRPNPGRGLKVYMGRLVELRYDRDHGAKPGFYKHTFRTKPRVFYYPGADRIVIEGR